MARITRRDLEKVYDLATGQLHKFTLHELFGHVLEVDSVHFHLNSAVLLPNDEPPAPDEDASPAADEAPPEAPPDGEDPGPSPQDLAAPGLAILRAVYAHAAKHPSQKLLITGHTDTSGGAAYNVQLGHKRAMSVKHALLGERDEWVELCMGQHRTEDYQQILTWIAKVWAADCDPDGVDNVYGQKTYRAVRAFQELYNDEFDAEIAVDGVVGRQTWGAIFDVYMEILADICDVDVDQLPAERARLKFVDDGKAAVGCGEHFPVDLPGVDGRKSADNRRVQVLFFDPGEVPELNCHPAADQCDPAQCEIYEKRFHFFWPIDPEPVPLLPRYRVELELGDIDALMTPIEAETHTDRGVRERLQAIGFFYSRLNHADVDERAEAAWAHFKEVTNQPSDAAAVAHLREQVRQVIVDGGALPAKGEIAKLRVPGTYCLTPEQYFSFLRSDGGGTRHHEESAVWQRNASIGRVPIAAKVEAKFRRRWRPAGGVSLHFQLDTPDEVPEGHAAAPPPLRATPTVSLENKQKIEGEVKKFDFHMTGHPKGYVEARRAERPPAGPLADNVHRDFGGKRGEPVTGTDVTRHLWERNNRRAHFHDARDLHDPMPSHQGHAVQVDTNARGEAVAVLMPGFMGGDRYKVRVFLAPLRGRPSDGRAFPAVFAETGTLVIWRILRFSKFLRWDYPAGTSPAQRKRCRGALRAFDLEKVSAAFRQAWLDVEVEPEAQTPTPISAAEHRAAIRFAKARVTPDMAQRYDIETLVRETGTSAGFIELLTADEYDAAPKSTPAPPKGWQSAASDKDYFTHMREIVELLLDQVVAYFSQNAIGGLTWLQVPAISSFTPDPPPDKPGKSTITLGSATPNRGVWMQGGEKAHGGFHDETVVALHEAGHICYGVHQFTKPVYVGEGRGDVPMHDGHDYTDLCIMGYLKCDVDFCGRCVLNLAGWNTRPLPPNPPGP